eukprot:7510369-Pyramimonas_sp.AAC.2
MKPPGTAPLAWVTVALPSETRQLGSLPCSPRPRAPRAARRCDPRAAADRALLRGPRCAHAW